MTIAILVTTLMGGGTERFAVVLANGLASKGHDVRLLTGPKKDNEYLLSEKVQRIVLYKKRSLWKISMALHDYLKNNQIEFCVALGIYPNFIAALSHFNLKTQIILSERNAPKEDRLSIWSKILRYLLYRLGDAYVFQTPDAKAFFSRNIQKRGVVIPNPIVEQLPNREEKTNHEIIAVGRLTKQKNYPILLDAFAQVVKKHTNYKLRIFGKGICEDALKSHVVQLGIADKVVFEGFSINVHEQIKSSEIYVLSSSFEGLPNALMEAMAMGFPVVSTDCPCGGPKMLINSHENGLLVPLGDSVAMASAICLYIENPELREKCAKMASKTRELYSVKKILDKWEEFLTSLPPKYENAN